jgi:hypothetical protein
LTRRGCALWLRRSRAGTLSWVLAAAGGALAAAVVFSPAAITSASAYADGAPPGFTGGFGEQACDACHFEATVNSQPGELTLAGIPPRYVPGERYTVSVTLSRPGMKMGGFQLATRFQDGGAQAGTLAPGPDEAERVKVETASNVQYAGQRQRGSGLTKADVALWTVIWTAPSTGGAVAFHAAGNAADGDEAARGDYVYTATAQSVSP